MTTLPAGAPSSPPLPSVRELGRPRSKMLRQIREFAIKGSLAICGIFSVVTTVVIVVTLFVETLKFFGFEDVSVVEFITGLEWNPLLGGEKHFGIWPLISGTLLVAAVAMCVALPLGLITAIYLSEYAPKKVRAVIKPILEILAGVPTVVFGFFALMVITPALRFDFLMVEQYDLQGNLLTDATGAPILGPWNPLSIGGYNALAAGIAVGIMCLPIVCSLTEDALQAVPRSLREAAYGLGSTRFDVSVKVVVPAALSGIVASFLLAIARAVGETMIVSLAAGATPPNIAENPVSAIDVTNDTQTMTGYMVQIFLGDTSNFGVEYYSSYAVALTLFVIVFAITMVGNWIRLKFREVYE